jgi:ABC-type transport system involved in multi-copper enzyme maturation permease subunit
VLTVVSKPVPRPVFVLGKYLGVLAAVTLVFAVLSMIFLLSIRHQVMSTASDQFDGPVLAFGFSLGVLLPVIVAGGANYYLRRPFISTLVAAVAAGQFLALVLVLLISPDWALQSPLHEFEINDHEKLKLLAGLAVVLMGVWMMAALALACSTRLGVVSTLLICVGFAVFGITSSALNQWVNQRLEIPAAVSIWDTFTLIGASAEPAGVKLAFYLSKTGYVVFPNLQFLWPSDAITQGRQIPLSHLGTLSVYAGMYVISFLAAATALFQRREVG